LYSCIWISYVKRNGRPISGYGLHSFSAYRSQLKEGFNEVPEISLYDVWHDVWHNVCIVWFLAPRSVARGGSITIWPERKSPLH
jgi:hypothetical protein